jgi:chemotaxis signal transduction protein
MSDIEGGVIATRLYQAIRCGALRVAFPYGWANTIVEKFEVTAVPKAPSWLLGATNIDGRIFPVIELAYVGAATGRASTTLRNQVSNNINRRLLIGGLESENNDDRLALVFDGLPQQIGGKEAKFAEHRHSGDSTSSLTDGTVESKTGERFALVNVQRLVVRLSSELSTL